MFQVNCPKCDGLIKSPLLVEVETIICVHCKENVDVEDVFVATKNFIMHRKDLLNRLLRFKTLLGAVEKEIQLMDNDHTVSEQSRKSVRQFRTFLKEMMQGARSNYRMDLQENLFIEINDNGQKRLAKLNNLSSKGASIELADGRHILKKNSEIIFKMLLPELAEDLTITGQVVWKEQLKRNEKLIHLFGIRFTQLEEKTRAHIWDFIQKSLPANHSKTWK